VLGLFAVQVDEPQLVGANFCLEVPWLPSNPGL